VKVDIEICHPTDQYSDYEMKIIRRTSKKVRKICRIMGIENPPTITFEENGGFGCYQDYYGPKITIGVRRILAHFDYGKGEGFWRRKVRDLKPYKFDVFIFVLAHELGHYRQARIDKILVSNIVKCRWRHYWRGKEVKRYDVSNPRYHALPPERDAHSWATYVTKELHREKYLY
jgi:hypothetical protein